MYIQEYRLIQTLGSGSFATTYLAERNSRYYALKLIRANMLQKSLVFSQRIEREIQILKSMNNPYVVTYIDDGFVSEGTQMFRYIVMEYVHGEILKACLLRRKLSLQESCLLGKRLFSGIYAVHSQHVIHRDLKPSNLMITSNQLDIKILDFGLSKQIDFRALNLTEQGQTLGTYSYMAPEQLLSAKEVDFRADFYSAGVILYEMLAGEKPIKMLNKKEAIPKLMHEIPIPLIQKGFGVPQEISDMVAILLKKHPLERNLTHIEIIACLNKYAKVII